MNERALRVLQAIAVAIILVCIVIAFSACSDPPPEQGYVTDKRFIPAHWEGGYETYYTTEIKCDSRYVSGYGTAPGQYVQECRPEPASHQRYEDHHEFVEDRWQLHLEDCKVEKDERKCKRGWRTVSETLYDRYSIGNHYPDPR